MYTMETSFLLTSSHHWLMNAPLVAFHSTTMKKTTVSRPVLWVKNKQSWKKNMIVQSNHCPITARRSQVWISDLWDLSVWRSHVLPVSARVPSCFSGFLPQSKGMHTRQSSLWHLRAKPVWVVKVVQVVSTWNLQWPGDLHTLNPARALLAAKVDSRKPLWTRVQEKVGWIKINTAKKNWPSSRS